MKKIFKYILIVFGLILTISCIVFYSGKSKPHNTSRTNNDKQGRYLGSLQNFQDFIKLSGEPLSKKFNDVRSIKVVYELRKNNLYFINSSKYKFHHLFCEEVLGFDGGLIAFNHNNYDENLDQEYCLANLNYYKSLNVYAIEFTSSTRYSAKQIIDFYKDISKNCWIKDSLKLLVSSEYLNSLDKEGALKLGKIYPSELYKGQIYQSLHQGVSYGILKKVEDLEKEYQQIKPQDIILIKGTPTNLPICQGIITNAFQTPLSHINVLCHNRKIPAAADLKIWDKDLEKFIGQPVKLSVNDTGIVLSLSTLDKVAQHLKSKRSSKSQNLFFNLDEQRLMLISQFSLNDKKTIGNKAAGLGELNKIAKRNPKLFKVPEGAFAIPFYYYHKHLSSNTIQVEINKLFKNQVYTLNNDSLKKQLKRIREAIKKQPIDAHLYEEVVQIIKSNNLGNSYRFRSSSNAEDAEGFSGAGLYESKTGILDDEKKSIEKAIKSVWASAWKYEAFAEREYSGINHRTMMMGVLVHKNFKDELANGVVITKNLYRENFPGFTVNVQKGEVSVVTPPDGIICEQFVCMAANDIDPFSGEMSIDYISHSSLSPNKLVLSKQEVTQLHQSLEAIKNHFYRKTYWGLDLNYNNFGLDLEFKFDKNGKLYIKQVRPY